MCGGCAGCWQRACAFTRRLLALLAARCAHCSRYRACTCVCMCLISVCICMCVRACVSFAKPAAPQRGDCMRRRSPAPRAAPPKHCRGHLRPLPPATPLPPRLTTRWRHQLGLPSSTRLREWEWWGGGRGQSRKGCGRGRAVGGETHALRRDAGAGASRCASACVLAYRNGLARDGSLARCCS